MRKLPAGFFARDINDRGAVVGTNYHESEGHRAAVWAANFGVRELDFGAARLGFPSAINESSIVVGSGEKHATIWTPFGRASRPWGDPGRPSTALSISDRGWIVGLAFLRGWGRPVLWLLGGRMIELPNREPDAPEGPAGGLALDVNDAGYIVGRIAVPFPHYRSAVWIVR